MYFGSIVICGSDLLERIHYFTSLIALFIHLSILMDDNFKPLRQCIYYGCTYTMKSSGYLVSSASELTAGMKDRKYYLYRRKSRFVVDTHRNSSSIVHNKNRIVLFNADINLGTISGQSLIDRIVYDLIDKMMKSADRCTSNVHSGSFSYCFQSFQNLNLVGSIFVIYFCFHAYLLVTSIVTVPSTTRNTRSSVILLSINSSRPVQVMIV